MGACLIGGMGACDWRYGGVSDWRLGACDWRYGGVSDWRYGACLIGGMGACLNGGMGVCRVWRWTS